MGSRNPICRGAEEDRGWVRRCLHPKSMISTAIDFLLLCSSDSDDDSDQDTEFFDWLRAEGRRLSYTVGEHFSEVR